MSNAVTRNIDLKSDYSEAVLTLRNRKRSLTLRIGQLADLPSDDQCKPEQLDRKAELGSFIRGLEVDIPACERAVAGIEERIRVEAWA